MTKSCVNTSFFIFLGVFARRWMLSAGSRHFYKRSGIERWLWAL